MARNMTVYEADSDNGMTVRELYDCLSDLMVSAPGNSEQRVLVKCKLSFSGHGAPVLTVTAEPT